MKTAITMLIAVLGMAIVAGGAYADAPLSLGEKWVYKHDGPRPWSPSGEDVEGDRFLEVIETEKEGGQQYWIIEESWGLYDVDPSTEYVDRKNAVVKRSLIEETFLHYNPGRPRDFSALKPGEEKVYDITMGQGDRDRGITLRIVAKRIEDETLTVPAGEYEDCVHVVTTWTLSYSMVDGGRPSMKGRTDYWHHPDVNGCVKEVYTFGATRMGDQFREGYTCTSELKSYSPGDVE